MFSKQKKQPETLTCTSSNPTKNSPICALPNGGNFNGELNLRNKKTDKIDTESLSNKNSKKSWPSSTLKKARFSSRSLKSLLFPRINSNDASIVESATLQRRLIKIQDPTYKKQKRSTSTPNLGPRSVKTLAFDDYYCVHGDQLIESHNNIAKILAESEIVKFITTTNRL